MARLKATQVTGSVIITQGALASGGFTGSLQGTASWAVSSSWSPATTISNSSSWASSSISSSYPWVGSGTASYLSTGLTNVGIGTSYPASPLHVAGDTIGASRLLTVANTTTSLWLGSLDLKAPFMSSSNTLYFTFGQSATTNNEAAMGFKFDGPGSSSNRLQFWLNNANDIFNILASKKVGINTQTPANALDVVGNISCSIITASLFYGTASWAISSSWAPSSTTSNSSSWASSSVSSSYPWIGSGNNIYPANTASNVGIGTSGTITYPLTVKDTDAGASTTLAVLADDDQLTFDVAKDANDNGYMSVRDGNQNAIIRLHSEGHSYISNSYNFGIGMSVPTKKLDVSGSIRGYVPNAVNVFTLERLGAVPGGLGIDFNSGWTRLLSLRDFSIWSSPDVDSGVGTERMRIVSSSGYVGIGTSSPSNKVEIVGGTTLLSASSNQLILANSDSSLSQSIFDLQSNGALSIRTKLGYNYFNAAGINYVFVYNGSDYGTLSGRFMSVSTGGEGTSIMFNKAGVSYISTSYNVGIGTASPTKKLDVNGNAAVSGSLWVNAINSLDAITPDLVINASDFIFLNSPTSVVVDSPLVPGLDNVYDFGGSTLYWKDLYVQNSIITGADINKRILIGYGAGTDTLVTAHTASTIIGYEAGFGCISQSNAVVIGWRAGGYTVAGSVQPNVVAIGYSALRATRTGSNAVVIGYFAGGAASFDIRDSVMVGTFAGYEADYSPFSVLIGRNAGYDANQSDGATIVGYYAGENADSCSYSVLVGSNAGRNAANSIYSVAIGYLANQNATTSSFSVAIGYLAGQNATSSVRNIFIGNYAGRSVARDNTLIIDSQDASAPSSSAFIYGEMDTKRLYFNADCYIPAGKMLYGTASFAISSSTQYVSQLTTSFASQSISSSWASSSISASYALTSSYISGSLQFVGKTSGFFPVWVDSTLSSTSSLAQSGSVVYSAGNVGVKTSTPTKELDVNGSAAVSGSLWVNTINSLDSISPDLTINASDFLLLDAATALLVDSDTLPYVDNSYDLGSTTYRWAMMYGTASLAVSSSYPWTGSGNYVALKNSNARVGIGISNSTAKLSVEGDVKIGEVLGGDLYFFDTGGGPTGLLRGEGSTELPSYLLAGASLETGFLGIGIETPGAKLHVQGEISCSNVLGTVATASYAVYSGSMKSGVISSSALGIYDEGGGVAYYTGSIVFTTPFADTNYSITTTYALEFPSYLVPGIFYGNVLAIASGTEDKTAGGFKIYTPISGAAAPGSFKIYWQAIPYGS